MNNSISIGKQEAMVFKGISVFAMVCLHLFCRSDLGIICHPILYLHNVPLAYFLGQASDWCVCGFAFCTGYVHYKTMNKPQIFHTRMKGVIKLLINYWIVLVIFIIIGKVQHNIIIPGSVSEVVKNVFMISNYNGAWWYVLIYILLVISSPLITKLIKTRPVSTGILLGIIYSASYWLRFHILENGWWFRQLYLYGMTVTEYGIGCYFEKYDIFYEVKCRLSKLPQIVLYFLSITIILGTIYIRGEYLQTLYVAPFFGCLYLLIYHCCFYKSIFDIVFSFLGKHSTNIWLTHMFFYTCIFPNWIYKYKYPIIIMIVLLLVTICISYLIMSIQYCLNTYVLNRVWEDV